MGQVVIHILQLMHLFLLTIAVLEIIEIASCGQTEMHPPHARHLLRSTNALGFSI